MKCSIPPHCMWISNSWNDNGIGKEKLRKSGMLMAAMIAGIILLLYSFPFPVLYLTGGSLSTDCNWKDFISVTPNEHRIFNWEKHIEKSGVVLSKQYDASCEGNFEEKAKHFSSSYTEANKKFQNQLSKTRWVFPVEGNTASFQPIHWLYWIAASHPGVRTICEIGFNAGHSSLIWLEANPKATVYSFDINHWRYTEPMVTYLKQAYPGRLHSCFGDSTVMVPFIAEKTNIKCDIAVVDGGHFDLVPLLDTINMRLISHNQTLVLIDDIGQANAPGVLGAVKKLRDVKFIETIFVCGQKEIDRSFGAFKYV